MDYAVAEETEFFNWFFGEDSIEELEAITEIEERFDNDYTELLNSEFYKLVTSNLDADLYDLNLYVYDEWDNKIWHGIAGMYPYEWIDVKVLDYSTYNVDGKVFMDMWIK